MKKYKYLLMLLLGLLLGVCVGITRHEAEAKEPTIGVEYTTHMQTIGWAGWAVLKPGASWERDRGDRSKYDIDADGKHWKENGETAGSEGASRRLEGIRIKLTGVDPSYGGIEYRTHIQTIGWAGWAVLKKGASWENDRGNRSKYDIDVDGNHWKKNGETAGSEGASRRLEAIQIRLTGEIAKDYDVYYRVHAQNFGWLDWARNGEVSGTSGLSSRLEGIQIVLRKKGEPIPGENYLIDKNSVKTKCKSASGGFSVAEDGTYLKYNYAAETMDNVKINDETKIIYNAASYLWNGMEGKMDFLWQGAVAEGSAAGTFGKNSPISSMQMMLTNSGRVGSNSGITYEAYKEDGWHKASNGKETDNDRSSKVRAMKISLTGEAANRYDIYYRTHVQNLGWLGWAKNGELAGSFKDLRLEGYQVMMVEKGSPAPSKSLGGFNEDKTYPFYCLHENTRGVEDGGDTVVICLDCKQEIDRITCSHPRKETRVVNGETIITCVFCKKELEHIACPHKNVTSVTENSVIKRICSDCGSLLSETKCDHSDTEKKVTESKIMTVCKTCGTVLSEEKNTCSHHFIQVRDESSDKIYKHNMCYCQNFDIDVAYIAFQKHPEWFDWVQKYIDNEKLSGPINFERVVDAHQDGYDRYPNLTFDERFEYIRSEEGRRCGGSKGFDTWETWYQCEYCGAVED